MMPLSPYDPKLEPFRKLIRYEIFLCRSLFVLFVLVSLSALAVYLRSGWPVALKDPFANPVLALIIWVYWMARAARCLWMGHVFEVLTKREPEPGRMTIGLRALTPSVFLESGSYFYCDEFARKEVIQRIGKDKRDCLVYFEPGTRDPIAVEVAGCILAQTKGAAVVRRLKDLTQPRNWLALDLPVRLVLTHKEVAERARARGEHDKDDAEGGLDLDNQAGQDVRTLDAAKARERN